MNKQSVYDKYCLNNGKHYSFQVFKAKTMQLAHGIYLSKKESKIILITVMSYQLWNQRYQQFMKSMKYGKVCMVAQNKVICVHPNLLARITVALKVEFKQGDHPDMNTANSLDENSLIAIEFSQSSSQEKYATEAKRRS